MPLAFMKNDAWEAKSCNTVLAGWAQLRHIWELQAKQNEDYFCSLSPPVGFVEPNTKFWGRMADLAAETWGKLELEGAFNKRSKLNIQMLWYKLENICRRLETISHKQLRKIELNESENNFIRYYDVSIAEIMFYNGSSYEEPNNDAPRIVDIFSNSEKGGYLHVGISRPRKIYVLYPWKGKDIILTKPTTKNMMKTKKKNLHILFIFCVFSACFATAKQLTNPVARCADCGVMKHRGTYYITGTGIPGQMLTSQNLTDWKGPYNFFKTKLKWTDKAHTVDMHAPGLKYYNGLFYFYWNGIAYATSKNPRGPYTDKNIYKPFDNDIDPFLFVDEDGKLYFYTVKFDDGNIIFGQKMDAPNKLKGKPIRLLDPRQVCWETLTGNILEGQEVIRYRGKCYMLYAANHTGTEYGNYMIGCAVSDSPLGFNEASKYPYPVMEQSDERISDSAKTIIAWGVNGGPEWRFTTNQPVENWSSPDFSESKSWEKSSGAFGWPIIKNSRKHNVKTPWLSSDIWARIEFELSELPSTNLQLKLRHLDSVEIYFNGMLVHTNLLWGGPKLAALSKKNIDALRIGKNVIAVHCSGPRKKKYLDVGLIDDADKIEDDLIWNTGQPTLLRGPNGFEWFLIYFGMWNEGPHCQGINRTFFFDRELYIDGPTGSRPPQYQPIPYPATFFDNFETHRLDRISEQPKETWEYFKNGHWRVVDNQAEVAKNWKFNSAPTGTAVALIRTEPSENYLFQAWVKPIKNKKGFCGIIAWQADENNWLRIYLDKVSHHRSGRSGSKCELKVNGTSPIIKSFKLQKDFNFSVYHKIRFEKNGNSAEIWIDDKRITLDKPLKIPSRKPGRPGIFSEKTRAVFDAVVYTIGWDEYDNRIRNWKPVIGSKENIKVNKKNGLILDAQKNKVVCTKGDLLDCYEFISQVTFDKMDTMDKMDKAGILPVYIDEKNWLSAEVEPATHRLIISGKRDGQNIEKIEKELAGWRRLYLRKPIPEVPANLQITASFCGEKNSVEAAADGLIAVSSKESLPLFSFWNHLGTREWIQYDFDESRKISGIEVIWYDDEKNGGECRTPESWELVYKRNDGSCQPVCLKIKSNFATTIDKLNVVHFDQIETKTLKMKIKSKKGFSSGLYEWTVLDPGSDSRIEFAEMNLKRSGLISGVKLRFENHAPFSKPLNFIIQYRNKKGSWKSVENPKLENDILKFNSVETDCLRIKLMVKPGTHCKVARAMARVESETTFNIRSVKLSDKVLIMINGKQQLEIPGSWPKSKVGITAENCSASFNGITCFKIK